MIESNNHPNTGNQLRLKQLFIYFIISIRKNIISESFYL